MLQGKLEVLQLDFKELDTQAEMRVAVLCWDRLLEERSATAAV
jgi:hypothetical protein